MEGFGVGLGAGLIMGIALVYLKLKWLITNGKIKIVDSKDKEITPDQLRSVFRMK